MLADGADSRIPVRGADLHEFRIGFVVVAISCLEVEQLRFEAGDGFRVGGVSVDVVQFLGIHFEIVEFPTRSGGWKVAPSQGGIKG